MKRKLSPSINVSKVSRSDDFVASPSALRIAGSHRIKELQEDQWHLEWIAKNLERHQTEKAVAVGQS